MERKTNKHLHNKLSPKSVSLGILRCASKHTSTICTRLSISRIDDDLANLLDQISIILVLADPNTQLTTPIGHIYKYLVEIYGLYTRPIICVCLV